MTLVAGIAVFGSVLVRLMPPDQLNRLLPIPVNELGGALQRQNEPEGMFGLSGADRAGFYPGVVRQMSVSVTNSFDFDVEVTELWATLDSTSSRRCKASPANLVVGEYEGAVLPLQVAAHAVQTVGVVPVSMPSNADQGCAGVHFSISLHGTATKVRQS